MNHVKNEGGEALSSVDVTHMVGNIIQLQRRGPACSSDLAFAAFQEAFAAAERKPCVETYRACVNAYDRYKSLADVEDPGFGGAA